MDISENHKQRIVFPLINRNVQTTNEHDGSVRILLLFEQLLLSVFISRFSQHEFYC